MQIFQKHYKKATMNCTMQKLSAEPSRWTLLAINQVTIHYPL